MKKKIKAFIMAIIICITSFFSNIVNASATVPGIVEAENVWLTLETLALTMGVNLPFIPDKSISYNNNQKKQEMIDYIDKELSDGVITQQQHDDAIQQLDNMLLYPGEHGVGSAINIGTQLWNSLSKFFYEKYIFASPDLTGTLSSSAKALFDAYSGPCAIYAVLDGDRPTIIVLSPYCLQFPIKGREYANVTYWQLCNGPSNENVNVIYNDGVTGTWSANMGNLFVGRSISVQYFANKAVNENVTVNDGENSLVSYPTYDDYVNGLNDVYSISNGQVVVTDTGEAPIVLDGDTIADTVAGINDGTVAWENAIPQIYSNDETGAIEGETPVIGKKALDEMVGGLNLNRLKSKFPFCIPSDLKQMISGAGETDDEAPTISVPCHIEFAGHVYYDSDELFVIDFNELENVVAVFRAGFFLLFLIGMVFLTIEVLHSFFVVTE